jgi:hypothetical protein
MLGPSRHYLVQLAVNSDSLALLSREREVQNAVIFTHGFLGNPVDTWAWFQVYMDANEDEALYNWWRSADAFFYGYESFNLNIPLHAVALQNFVASVFPRPGPDVVKAADPVWREKLIEKMGPLFDPQPTLDSALHRSYSRLFLVGHSLGGVVLRQAILDWAIQEESLSSGSPVTMILDAELRLFAPAIFGANPAGLIGLAYHFVMGSLKYSQWVNPVMKSSRVLRQLKEDSTKLERIRTDTEQLASVRKLRALTAHVLFGADEQIVEPDKYKHDHLDVAEKGHNHWSICKPFHNFRKPLKFVVYGKRPNQFAAPE